MDLAYDHIQEEALSQDKPVENQAKGSETTLNADFQEAYKAISSSPWGARLGGFLGSVVKQGESVYREAQQELTVVGEEATKGFTDLRSTIISRTRSISQVQKQTSADTAALDQNATCQEDGPTDESIQETEGVLARLRTEAAKRLREFEKAEDAADEALLKFGTKLRNFLGDAVSIAPPPSGNEAQTSTVLFESKDAQGKRVIHTTRFDAQLHVIHTTLNSFTEDPDSGEYESWIKTFSVESKTELISKDLETYAELRSSMEKLVPDQVAYEDFWRRYYFLRHSIETAEARRRDLLKAVKEEVEVKWDEDSEDDADCNITKTKASDEPIRRASTESSNTLHAGSQKDATHLKVQEPRKSDEKSQADSDASYDVVSAMSGAPSHAPDSPKDERKAEDSDEEDWE